MEFWTIFSHTISSRQLPEFIETYTQLLLKCVFVVGFSIREHSRICCYGVAVCAICSRSLYLMLKIGRFVVVDSMELVHSDPIQVEPHRKPRFVYDKPHRYSTSMCFVVRFRKSFIVLPCASKFHEKFHLKKINEQ